MNSLETDQSGGWRGKVALGALVFAILAVLWFMAAALGTKFGLWSWQFGLLTMTVGLGRIVAVGACAVSVVALIVGLIKSPRKQPVMLAIGALVVSGLLTGRLVSLGAQASAVPAIHDIQTDWADPVVLSEEMLAVRGPNARPVRYGDKAVWDFRDEGPLVGRLIADIQEEAEYDPAHDEDRDDKPYGTIEPLILDGSPADVFDAVVQMAERRGWRIVTSNVENLTIEATHESGWFGFKDDVAIRIRAEGQGSRVDMRSISRVGVSDLGANEKRVRIFLYELAAQRFGQ